MKNIDQDNFLVFCMHHYDNPHCSDVSEFQEDLRRIQMIKKLITKYKQTGELKERMIMNHMTILYNVFGKSATQILFFKMDHYHSVLKPFAEILNYLPDSILINSKLLRTSEIKSDPFVQQRVQEMIK